jgi:predicted nucleic acid-binding Zn ribbon protein
MSYTNWDNLKPKTCPRCGKIFKPVNPRQTYCSHECRRGTATCKVCGKSFVLKSNTTGEYCSHDCWYKSGDAKLYPGRECPVCHSNFSAKSVKQKFCSSKCAGIGKSKSQGPRTCKACGAEIEHTRYSAVYCSAECRRIGIRHAWTTRAKSAGTKRTNSYGYILVKVDQRTWRQEHRIVMEQKLGRPLGRQEKVHHINGIRSDNRPENLEVWENAHPPGTRKLDDVKHLILELDEEQRATLLKWLTERT